jgi:hypothetical protein
VTSIDYEINDNYVSVESYFHPSSSFVYNKNTNSQDLLTHELYHFKITEYFSRKAKKEISQYKVITNEQIKDIIENVKKRSRNFK